MHIDNINVWEAFILFAGIAVIRLIYLFMKDWIKVIVNERRIRCDWKFIKKMRKRRREKRRVC